MYAVKGELHHLSYVSNNKRWVIVSRMIIQKGLE